MTTTFRARAMAAAIATSLLLVGARAGEDASPAAQSGDDAPSVLRLQDPGKASVLAYAKREGLLEAALAETGTTVEWGVRTRRPPRPSTPSTPAR